MRSINLLLLGFIGFLLFGWGSIWTASYLFGPSSIFVFGMSLVSYLLMSIAMLLGGAFMVGLAVKIGLTARGH